MSPKRHFQLLVICLLPLLLGLVIVLTPGTAHASCGGSSVANEGELQAAIEIFNGMSTACDYTILLSADIPLSQALTPIGNPTPGALLIIESNGFSVEGERHASLDSLVINSGTQVEMRPLPTIASNPSPRLGAIVINSGLTLSDHTPVTNAVGVDVGGSITAAFTANLNASSVTSRSFAVRSSFRGFYTETATVSGDLLTLDPSLDFFTGEQVEVVGTAAIRDQSGNGLNPTQWSFRAGPVTNRCVDGFTEIDTQFNGAQSGGVAWGDYDRDGDLDLLLTGYDGDTVTKLYRNDGSDSFSEVNVGLPELQRSTVDWGDYDSDGDLDILLSGLSSGGLRTRVYRNDGSDTFTYIGANLTGVYVGTADWGDYDNDGDLDIVVTGNAGNFVGRKAILYRNDGGDSFSEVSVTLTAVKFGDVEWGDYDGDGDLDLLLTGSSDSSGRVTKLYRNDGNDLFTEVAIGFPGVEYSGVAWGDYDNDGDLDLLITGLATGNILTTALFRNDGAASFTLVNAGLAPVYWGSVSWGDYDNDGDLDILLTGTISGGRIAEVYRNEGGDVFTAIGAGLPGVIESRAAWGDYDNDGDLDIFLVGQDSTNARIGKLYRNDDCAPEVEVLGQGSTIQSGDSTPDSADDTDFGHAVKGATPLIHTFTISNTGSATLTLTGSPVVTLDSGSSFRVIAQPGSSDVAPGGATTFDLQFDPQAQGTLSDTVSITSNDADESFYTFVVSGFGCDPAQTQSADDETTLNRAIDCFNQTSSPGTFTISQTQNISLTSSTTAVDNATAGVFLTIAGNDFILDGQGIGGVRPMDIAVDTHVTLNAIVISGGNVTGNEDGGGIRNRGSLTITDSIISGNLAGGNGGGIENESGSLSLSHSTLSNNEAGNRGGGLHTSGSSPMLSNVIIMSNEAGNDGGGLYSESAFGSPHPVLHQVTFDDNRAESGGGFYDGATSTLVDSTFINNHATSDGGAIAAFYATQTLTGTSIISNTAADKGGGIYAAFSDFDLTNATVSHNMAGAGGGIHVSYGSVRLTHLTLFENSASGTGGAIYNAYSLDGVSSSILWGNTASAGPQIYDDNNSATISYSLIQDAFDASNVWDTSLGTDGGGNLDDDPLLAALADNGGPTLTHALGTGSPALDQIPVGVNGCATQISDDQRGKTRPYLNCDMGAFEQQNEAPAATDDSYTTAEDMVLTVAAPGVLSHDSDPNGTAMTSTLDSGPSLGALLLQSDGSFVYTPTLNVSGTDSFTYTVSDGDLSDSANVSIIITPLPDAPVGVEDSYTTSSGAALVIPAPGLLSNDSDPDGDSLNIILVTVPANGSLTAFGDDGSFTYTPSGTFSGVDLFTYRISDGSLESSTVNVQITVEATANGAPVAVDDSYTTDEDTPLIVQIPHRGRTLDNLLSELGWADTLDVSIAAAVSGSLLENDGDPDGDDLSASRLSRPSHGEVVVNSVGEFIYVPEANFNGTDSFTYAASDGSLSDTATATVTVNAVNDAPVAAADVYTLDEEDRLTVPAPGVLSNDSDPVENNPLSVKVGEIPRSGRLSLSGDGSFVYTPTVGSTGEFTFTYVLSDGMDTDTAVVSLTVRAGAPTAPDVALSGPGWDLFGWPLQRSYSVAEGLQSISGFYSTVYGYEPTDTADPWKIYHVSMPPELNDLDSFEFGRGYWISVTQNVTVSVASLVGVPPLRSLDGALPPPPATLWGVIHGAATDGTVLAEVDGVLCGAGEVIEMMQGLYYRVDVATDAERPGCGSAGASLSLRSGDVIRTVSWPGTGSYRLDLGQSHLYLPRVGTTTRSQSEETVQPAVDHRLHLPALRNQARP